MLIEYEKGKLDVEKHIGARADERFFLSVITASELLHGVHRANTSDVRRRRSVFVEAILARFPILPIDVATARAHAELWAELAASGQLIGAHDMLLAASCLAHDLHIATANVREFRRVKGLVVEDWSQ